MNFFSKNKFVFWLLIFLVVINLTVLITFVVMYSRKPDAITQQVPEKPGLALQKELTLTPSQSEHVDLILADYRKVTDPVAEGIRGYRVRILNELANDKPDTFKINHYADSVCYLQRQMQKASVKQYMALKEICNPEQCKRLSSLYFELYGFQGQGKGMGQQKGMRNQYRWGKRNNSRGN
ncbi:MAG: periplasmic heavy metal sensor [Bacteroidetes bacterium]|nr:periplasmic heavy metal sensor [Bacteroidota bacterium]